MSSEYKYKILCSHNPYELEEEITKHLKEDYKLGSTTIIQNLGSFWSDITVCQTVYKIPTGFRPCKSCNSSINRVAPP